MDILCLTHGDGSNRNFQKYTNTLKCGGHKVSVVAWDRLQNHNSNDNGNSIPHRFIMRGGGLRNKFLAFWYPLWMLRLSLFLLTKRVDLIWAKNFATAFPAALASLYTGNRFIYCIHDNLCLTYRFPVITDTLLRWLDKWTIRQASAVIIPNAHLVEEHAEPYRHKFRVFPNSPSLKKMPGDDGKNDKPPFCVYVNGSLWNTRGIEVLFKAAEQVPGCSILIAGELPGKGIEEAINSSSQVNFKGWLDHEDALRLYGQAKAVFAFYDPAIPINVCTSPSKFYEAMLMGKPVIINSEAHISEQVREWKTGYTCGYHDINGLADILREIAKNPGEAERKGARARQLFEKRFAWEYFEPKLLGLVGSLGIEGNVQKGHDYSIICDG